MQKHINMTDIAKMAGVTQATVSRIINQKPGFRKATRDRVLDIMSSMGYQSHIFEQLQQMRRKTLTCSLLVCSLSEQKHSLQLPFFRGLADSLQSIFQKFRVELRARELPFGVLVPPEEETDAYLLCGAPSDSLYHNILSTRKPFLLIGDQESRDAECNQIIFSTLKTGVQIVNYLLKENCRRIGYLADRTCLEICAGMELQLQKNGLMIRPEDRKILFSTDASHAPAGLEEWLHANSLPDGIFINHVESFRAILPILKQYKIRVPEDLKIVILGTSVRKKADDIPIVPTFYIFPKTTALLAARRLMDILEHPGEPPCSILVPRILRLPEINRKKPYSKRKDSAK